jgi:spore coat polysaccharide biosynthesis protein SpsF
VSPRVVAVVQARMSSQRLPGKVLAELPDREGRRRAVLDWVVGRLWRARTLDDVVVATSEDPTDDPIAEHCTVRGVSVYRGSLRDVLDRYHSVVRSSCADVVVRITADCPLVDPRVVDRVVHAHRASGSTFTANRLPPPYPRTWPVGLDVEVVGATDLATAWREARQPHHREHVMPWFYEEPGRFPVTIVDSPVPAADARWTVDTRPDLEAVRGLVRAAAGDIATPWEDFLEVWRRHPELALLNHEVRQRTAGEVAAPGRRD